MQSITGQDMLNLEQLLAFITAAEKGSFSAAARYMGKSQGAISITISNLELDLGMTLFDRSGKYPRLTPQGTRLLEQSRVLLRQAERIQRYSEQATAQVEDSLTIAIDELVPLSVVEVSLEELSQKYPLTEIRLLRTSNKEFEAILTDGQADMGINLVYTAVPKNMDFMSIADVRWSYVCSPDSPLADKDVVEIEDMLCHRQIACSAMLDNEFWSSMGKISQELWRSQSQTDVVNLVEHGIGWAVLPKTTVEDKIGSGSLIEFTPGFHIHSGSTLVDLIWPTNARMGPAAEFFIQSLKQRAKLD